MILVTGGCFQGKRKYAGELFNIQENKWVDGNNCRKEQLFEAAAVDHFHVYIRRFLLELEAFDGFAKKLLAVNPSIVILADEIGNGIVPMEKEERDYREQAGRVLCAVAAASTQVHRVVCGIGTVIKDERK